MRCDSERSRTTWRPDPAAAYLVIDQSTGRMTISTGRDLLARVGTSAGSPAFAVGALRHGPRYVLETANGLLIVEQQNTADGMASDNAPTCTEGRASV